MMGPSILPGRSRRIRNPSEEIVKPQLTSIIDMMVFLLIFILKTFSTETTVITPSADLALPSSLSKQAPRPALMIEVTAAHVLVEGEPVTTLAEIGKSESILVPSLYSHLKKKVEQTGGEEKTREVMVQCDRKIDFKYLKKILGTCARASYSDFSLLVLQKE